MGKVVLARWLGIPAAGLLCAVLILNSVPLRIRFELSRAAFDRAVATGQPDLGTVGLYPIGLIETQADGGTYFYSDEGGSFGGYCGFVYEPGGKAPNVAFNESLGGGWWFWCDGD